MQSVDKLLTLAEQQIDEKEYCTVDNDTRVVTVPEVYKMLGVESDKKAKRIWFKFPKLVGNNGLNLMELKIRINYRNAAGDGDVYVVTDKKEEKDSVIFSWELYDNVTKQKGKIQFVVCAIKTKTDGSIINEWNTKLNSECESFEGLEIKQEVEKENPEIIEYILANLGGTVTKEQIAEALKEYLAENPINVPKKLSDLQDDEEHRTVTDKEKKSWNNRQALTITYNGQTYTYDGSEAVAITIETGGIERIEKLATDTTVTLEPNKLYVFPEMESLAYTIKGTGEVHFIFRSGATATRVVHPSGVNIGSFTVDANKIYEVSILEGLLTSQNWSVN